MLLSQKLHSLREEISNAHGLTEELSDGFNRCIEDAEYLEQKQKLLSEIEKGVGEFYDDENPKNGDLCDIGEVVATKLGYL